MFHDIAKGRGGDHSELGAVDAESFCLEQGLGRYEARLVAWLVKHHLILSITAQKKDISDPEVIRTFATRVGDQTHLDYLYVLTVADVRGTNPKLWNAWKARLFEEILPAHEAGAAPRPRNAGRPGGADPRDARQRAREKLGGIAQEQIERVWSQWTATYFLRFTAEEIAWHTVLLADRHPFDDAPLVAVRQLHDRGGTAVLTYTPRRLHSFARTTAVLDQMGLNVVDARLILERQRFQPGDLRRARRQRRGHHRSAAHRRDRAGPVAEPATAAGLAGSGDAPRAASGAHVLDADSGRVSHDTRNHRTILELIAADRPGLLSEVGKVLKTERIAIDGAKIMTVGERAEDVFYITNMDGKPLTDEFSERLKETLIKALDRREPARA